nr:hypothetical protein [Candidatus Sigynarchaeum springense]
MTRAWNIRKLHKRIGMVKAVPHGMARFPDLLDKAIPRFQSAIQSELPRRGGTLIEKRWRRRDPWLFSTDRKTIKVSITNDRMLRTIFKKAVEPHMDGESIQLVAEGTLMYLLTHELYHGVEAPFSTAGPDSDQKHIINAIRQGIKAADPDMRPLQQIKRVRSMINLMTDFIVDNRIFLDNGRMKLFDGKFIPVFDLVEMYNDPRASILRSWRPLNPPIKMMSQFTVSRYIYAVLYGNQAVKDLFEGIIGPAGVNLAKQALESLIGAKIALNVMMEDNQQELAQRIRAVFSGQGRYGGVKRLSEALALLPDDGVPPGRGDTPPPSERGILEEFLDEGTDPEWLEFLEDLAADLQDESETSSSRGHADGALSPMGELDLITRHEFYKRNHGVIRLSGEQVSGKTVPINVNRERWYIKKKQIIGAEDLSRLNLNAIERFERKTKLPVLVPLDAGSFLLTEYARKVYPSKMQVPAGIRIPDEISFYLDSSGSMCRHNKEDFNDGSRWHALLTVFYSIIDALLQASQLSGAECIIRVHNFATEQVNSPSISLRDFWGGKDLDVLTTIFKPDNGGDTNLNIEIPSLKADGKKRAYIVVTDGDLTGANSAKREGAKMAQLAVNPDNLVVLFEIEGEHELGVEIKDNPRITYIPVQDIKSILKKGLDLLLWV